MANTTALARMPGLPGKTPESKRQRLDALRTQLKGARQSFESHWKEIAELLRPRRLRLQTSDRNKGDKRNQKIVDSTGVFAANTFAAGMTTGITSAARIWFRMTIADKELLERENVKRWLEEVRERMASVLLRSNFYSVLPTFYSDLGVFGTTAQIVEEDAEKVIRCAHVALGEYWVGYNEKQQVRVFMREFQMTVRQIVGKFGKRLPTGEISTENLSETVQSNWRNAATEIGIDVCHIIYENPDYDETRLNAKHKRFASCYFEVGGRTNVFLEEGGYNEWPVMAVRWETAGGDVYGTDCPGMTALGDVKELMFSKKLGQGALHKAVNPPMIAPAGMKNIASSILPGGVTYFDETTEKKYRAAVDTTQFRLDYLQVWVKDIRDLIKRAFREDLFLMISNIEREVTATEVLEKKEEKLMALGPVLEAVNEGFLDPFFDRLYGIMSRRGMFPPPPPELADVEFHPEYESVMAQAQRAQGRTGIEAFSIFVQSVAKEDPTALDRVDTDEMIKRYAEVAGVPPKFIKTDEAVAAIRKARADAAAKQQAAENASVVADSANKLAGSDTSGKNALTDLLASTAPNNALSGAPSPQGGL